MSLFLVVTCYIDALMSPVHLFLTTRQTKIKMVDVEEPLALVYNASTDQETAFRTIDDLMIFLHDIFHHGAIVLTFEMADPAGGPEYSGEVLQLSRAGLGSALLSTILTIASRSAEGPQVTILAHQHSFVHLVEEVRRQFDATHFQVLQNNGDPI